MLRYTAITTCTTIVCALTIAFSQLHASDTDDTDAGGSGETAEDIGEELSGKKLALQCSVCHGRDGLSKDPIAPNLAGQPALYLEKSMGEYKDGTRQDRRMSLIAQALSDEQIKALAKWYASFEVTVKVPEE